MTKFVRINVPLGEGRQSSAFLLGTIYAEERIARISELFVPESERGKGYGKMLMEAFESIVSFQFEPPYQISLMSVSSAVGFYRKLGYATTRDFFFDMEKEIISVEEACLN